MSFFKSLAKKTTKGTDFQKDYFVPVRKTSDSTKCPYCGREYHHSSYGPQVVVTKIDTYVFQPKIETVSHDTRQPFRCDSCGAEFMLNASIPVCGYSGYNSSSGFSRRVPSFEEFISRNTSQLLE